MIDGIEFASRHVIVAIGITTKGRKVALNRGGADRKRGVALPANPTETVDILLFSADDALI